MGAMTKKRKVVLGVELTFDEWTARHAGETDDIVRELRETMDDYFLGGAHVKVRVLSDNGED